MRFNQMLLSSAAMCLHLSEHTFHFTEDPNRIVNQIE
jgi:hypothetical protein